MKKSLIFAGMLVVGFANAQYEGRVGVNTETPSATLNVKSKTGTTSATKNFELENADGTKMVTVLDNGKVGIGTDKPTTALTIVDTDSSDQSRDNLTIKSYANSSIDANPHVIGYASGGTESSPLNVVAGTTLIGLSGMGYPTSNLQGVINLRSAQDFTTSSAPTQWVFATTPIDRVDAVNVMTIGSQGNVLIGDTRDNYVGQHMIAPKASLEINVSPINLREYATSNEGLLIPRLTKERVSRMSSPETSTLIYVKNLEYTGNDLRVSKITSTGFYYFDGTEWVRMLEETNSLSLLWKRDADAVKLMVDSQGEERTQSNEVTITDTGMIKATSFQGANGATIFPDYVFQKYYTGNSSIKADYTFKTLSQVEDFVKTNGHLPGYKSAEAIKAQGYVDLMETQLTNVEKIEELYLHSIEQEKNLKELKNQNDELKAKNQELETRLEKLEKLLK